MKKLIVGLYVLFFSTACSIAEVPNPDVSVIQSIQRSVECLAKNIYFEARGESYIGQIAVAHVTINRVLSGRYADSICDVVYQKNQFSWTSASHRIRDLVLYNRAKEIAEDVILGQTKDPTNGAVNFHNRTVVSSRRPIAKIGNHVFYK